MTTYRKWPAVLLAGCVPALLEAMLLAVSTPFDGWLFVQSVFFWFTCGTVGALAVPPRAGAFAAIALSVFLCFPWYIALAVEPGTYEMLAPLVMASILFGGAIAGTLRIVDNREQRGEENQRQTKSGI